MKEYAVYDSGGAIVATVFGPDDAPFSAWGSYSYIEIPPGTDVSNMHVAGGELVAGLVDTRPLAQVQAAQVSALQAAYQAAINAPVTFENAAGVTSTYPAGSTVALNGATSTQNLNDCIAAGAPAWTLGHWLDTNNTAQVFTYADLQGLAAAMEAQEVYDWTDLVAKVAEVQAATTTAAVEAITF